MGDIIVDNIKPIHNGQSFFEFIPNGRAEASFKLQVHRTADSVREFTVPAANHQYSTYASLLGPSTGVYQKDEQIEF